MGPVRNWTSSLNDLAIKICDQSLFNFNKLSNKFHKIKNEVIQQVSQHFVITIDDRFDRLYSVYDKMMFVISPCCFGKL